MWNKDNSNRAAPHWSLSAKHTNIWKVPTPEDLHSDDEDRKKKPSRTLWCPGKLCKESSCDGQQLSRLQLEFIKETSEATNLKSKQPHTTAVTRRKTESWTSPLLSQFRSMRHKLGHRLPSGEELCIFITGFEHCQVISL